MPLKLPASLFWSIVLIKSSNYNLRPHHSLCIQFFIGKGYIKKFVEEMIKTIQMLDTENPLLTLTDQCDIICRFCPNRNGKRCMDETKVSAIDQRCLDTCRLKTGDQIHWQQLKIIARQQVIVPHRIPYVCNNCCWRSICEHSSPTEYHQSTL